MRRHEVRSISGLALLCVLLAGCSTAKVTASNPVGAAPAARPAVVYVADFEIDAASIQTDSGVLGARPLGILPEGPLARLRGGDPQAEARHLVDLMAEDIVADLRKKGLQASRLPAGAALPAEGWLVRGMFLQVGEGNRLRRAVIGLGSGATELQVASSVDALSQGTPAPFYQVDTGAESRKLPGAAVTLNPYVAAVRFVMAGKDLDRNVKDTAAKIAESVAARVNAAR